MKRLLQYRTAGMLLAMWLTLTASLSATTRLVPQQYGTIQAAIDSATTGDSVLVSGGIYAPSTNGEAFPIVMKNGVSLIGTSGPEFTWLQANSTGSVIACIDVDSATVITGFRITKGSAGYGGGIYCLRSSVTITGNTITENQATYGGGVYSDSSAAHVAGNTISVNTASYGGGVYNRNGTVYLHQNTIADNYAYAGHSAYGGQPVYGYAGGIYADSCTVDIVGNTIDGNQLFFSGWYPKAHGGGLYLNACEGAVAMNIIKGNVIFGHWNYLIHSMGMGAGICWLNSANVTIDSNTFVGNAISVPDYSSILGAGIYVDYGFQPRITRNLFARNTLSQSGGNTGSGLCIANSVGAILDHNTWADNTGSAVTVSNTSLSFTNSIIAGTLSGVGLTWDPASTMTVRYSNFWNNLSGNFNGTLTGLGDTTWGRNPNGTPCDKYRNIARDPLFAADSTYGLTALSPCLDAGDPSSPLDSDGTIADQGVYSFTHVVSYLNVIATPSPADVSVDSILVGKTPLLLANIVPGWHAVSIQVNGYQIWADSVLVPLGGTAYVNATLTDVGNEDSNLPAVFAVYQNYPNPFNPSTTIAYDLPRSADVDVTIYNLLGQRVRTLVSQRQPAGTHHVTWEGNAADGQAASSGVYLYIVRTDNHVQSRKMLLMK